MARYRKIDPRIWKDEHFRLLSPQEKLITFYVITAQSNRIGLFNFSPALASEDLGFSPETFLEGFRKVCFSLSWQYDESSRTLYLPTWWKYNCPENPNVLKACLADLHDLPKTPLFTIFCANFSFLPETFHRTFQEGLLQPSHKQCPNQEQEQEQEQDTYIASSHVEEAKELPPVLEPAPIRKRISHEYSENFETWWESYPNTNGSKKNAWGTWEKQRKAGKLLTLAEMIAAVYYETRQNPKWKNGYVPYAERWLKSERYVEAAALQIQENEKEELLLPSRNGSLPSPSSLLYPDIDPNDPLLRDPDDL